jgi:hypothetical protein
MLLYKSEYCISLNPDNPHDGNKLYSLRSLLEVVGDLNRGSSPPTFGTDRLYVPGTCMSGVDGSALICTFEALHG